ncbi:universal stress protein [Pelagimonas varians]|uniref:Universal stress protein family protein n=1 Tax=Pelagimonas varians TaxID=696760 RepID=A0A238KTS1_9RHOB|nr:universal stress protein [Pelagimonas varians]PYG32601.1 nucleotide-binding universal stress UspA family protein [Pelagimonas varians]SMX46107.1 Universal stress protein family protein [Pelagimonas varians]
MSIRNILVAFNGSDSAVSALKYAVSLAGDDAHVTALLAHSTHQTVNSNDAWVPAKAREIIQQANADILDTIATRFESLRSSFDLGDRLTFQRAAGRVDAVLAECARGYDLLVVGQDRGEGVDEHVTLHPDRIALMSGRPILIVPRGYDAQASHTHAVMAWDGGRAAARALSDSLGLLEAQGRVTVLTIGDTPTPRPVSEVLLQLTRHGVTANHQSIVAEPGMARALLAYCREQDPCLLVMGAYEHSKFREDFLGGVTARVLRDTPIPVLLSH